MLDEAGSSVSVEFGGGELGKDGGEGSSLGRQGPGFEKMEGLCKCGEREIFQNYVRYVWNNLTSSSVIDG